MDKLFLNIFRDRCLERRVKLDPVNQELLKQLKEGIKNRSYWSM